MSVCICCCESFSFLQTEKEILCTVLETLRCYNWLLYHYFKLTDIYIFKLIISPTDQSIALNILYLHLKINSTKSCAIKIEGGSESPVSFLHTFFVCHVGGKIKIFLKGLLMQTQNKHIILKPVILLIIKLFFFFFLIL